MNSKPPTSPVKSGAFGVQASNQEYDVIDPLEKLCYHDPRNPFHNADDDTAPRDGCACDNCFYGRDQMALEIIRLRAGLMWIANMQELGVPSYQAIALQTLEP